MSTITITTRTTKHGPRYAVRYRLGGRAYPLVSGGTFTTLKEARARRDFVAGEIAHGRNPADALRQVRHVTKVRTLRQWADLYRESRVDAAFETKKALRTHVHALGSLADREPESVTFADVAAWIASLGLKSSSIRRYLATLRATFDFAGMTGERNPARDSRVRLPREEASTVEPPSAQDVQTILEHVPPRWRLPLRTLEQTGMRVGELASLCWGDVDESGSRFRVKAGKTAAARRWVQVPTAVMAEIANTCPREDRTAERRVFPGCLPEAAAKVMGRACVAAGIVHLTRTTCATATRACRLPAACRRRNSPRNSATVARA